MLRHRSSHLVFLGLLITIRLHAQNVSSDNAHAQPNYRQIPLYFEENRGQGDQDAAYVARGANLLALVTREGVTLSTSGRTVSMRVARANKHGRFEAEGETEGVTNYYLGSRAFVGLRHYSAVRVSNIHPKIDVLYQGNGPALEYDFLVHPGANTGDLRLVFDGANRLKLADNGDIILSTAAGEVRQKKPRAWQLVGTKREELACHYALSARNEVRLVLGRHSRSAELVIDPIVSYSTYLGGTGADLATAVAVDSSGDAYVTGWTQSKDFPVTAGKLLGSENAFVTELNPAGSALIYSTYIGGDAEDGGYGIAVDNGGNAYITGGTTSTDFPFTNGHSVAGQDAFVVKLGPTGAIEYATALAGSGTEIGSGVAVDSSGAAYVDGGTNSSDFPVTKHSFMTKLPGRSSAFVAKLLPSGEISYATFLGGKDDDGAGSIAIDSSGDAYIGGSTGSSNFPVTAGAYSTTFHGETDVFVAELNPTGSALIYATFLGGSLGDYAGGIAVDSTGCYVMGTTFSGDFPVTPGAYLTVKPSPAAGDSSVFVAKLSPTGTSLLYATFLGGNGDDTPAAIAVNAGSAYVVGMTLSANFPTTVGALKERLPGLFDYETEMFLSEISPDGSTLSYSTLYGGSNYPSIASALGVAIDGNGAVYMVGTTAGVEGGYLFPTSPGAFQAQSPKASVNYMGQSGAIVKIDFSSPTLCLPSVSPESQDLSGNGGAFSFSLTLAADCPWEAIPDQYITLNAPFYGFVTSSPIEISGTVGQNNASQPFTGSVRVGPATFTVNQAAGSCSEPLITPSPIMFDSSGGPTSLSLTLPASCNWTVVSPVPWLSVTANSSGTGPASITISAGLNSFSERGATLIVAGTPISVTQTGSTCTATAGGGPLSFSGLGGTGLASITTGPACAWTAYGNVPWIQMSSSSSNGLGSGGAAFVVASNPSSTGRMGSLLIADQMLTITQSAGPAGSVSSYTVSTFAGGGSSSTPAKGDGGPASKAYFSYLLGLAWDATTGTFFVLDGPNGSPLLRAFTPDGNINTIAGGGSGTGENIPATSADLGNAFFVGVDNFSAVYISDLTSRVRKIAQGNIATFAGGATTGFSGDGSAATSALLSYPEGLASDSAGNIYIADGMNHRIREVSGGIISTVVGGGTGGVVNGIPPTSATLSGPYGIAFDATGNLYFTDSNSLVRKVSQGTITTIAGGGSGGDGGPAIKASLSAPEGVAVDPLGNVFVYENGYSRIRMVSVGGIISTITPYGAAPNGVITDNSGNVYYTDNGQFSTVRELTPVPNFCPYSVAPPLSLPPAGGLFFVAVTAAVGCNWVASSASSWITISSGASGAGNGTVSYIVTANSGVGRSGTLIIAGQTITVNQSPGVISPDSVNPGAGNTLTQTPTFTFDDPNGYADLAVANVLINSSLDGIGACYMAFVPSGAASGYLYLVDDAGDGGYASGSPIAIPSASTLRNRQCTINGTGSSVSGSGNTLTLTLAITFNSKFVGNKVTFVAARNNSGGNSGWQAMGTWDVPGTAPAGPAVGGVIPARSAASGGTYSFTFTDTNGFADLAVVNVLTNNFLDGMGACYVAFAPTSATSGSLYLVDDAGDGGYVSGSPITVPSSSTLQNSQCTISGTGSSVSASDNTLILNLAITFSSTFTGNQVFYLAARNNSTGNSGWQAVGSVTVP